MLTANSPSAYDKEYGKMVKFVKEKPVKRGYLKSWMDWWDERKLWRRRSYAGQPLQSRSKLTHRHDKRAKSGNGKKRRASSKSSYEGNTQGLKITEENDTHGGQ